MNRPRKRVIVLGAAGRVGSQICAELLRADVDVVLVDVLPRTQLEQRAGRLLNDALLASDRSTASAAVCGDFDATDRDALVTLFAGERPDLVINYAIPITWDATKRLPNYARISAAGLGAFTPIQVLVPLLVGRALAESGVRCNYMVGNLPDITGPVITAIAGAGGVTPPLCGAGNVGLNQVALRRQVAEDRGVTIDGVDVALVSHHVHWVAPREPGYSNEAPFLAKVAVSGTDITAEFSKLRDVMNRAVQAFYEPDAGFSSTTGILASRVALALLDDSGAKHRMHVPAPNGLPGGYPVAISGGEVSVDLPQEWKLEDAVQAMEVCHTLDGVEAIETDGSVRFTDAARDILRDEVGFELPACMAPGDIGQVAAAQIATLKARFP